MMATASSAAEHYESLLAGLAQRNRLRTLSRRQGADFSSNDYLALSDDPGIRRVLVEALQRGVPFGSGGSRLLRGNHEEHEALESEAAQFFGAAKTLYFGSGYVANLALFSLLPQQDDLIVYDALVHASCHEGMRAGRASSVAAVHNDPGAFEEAIRAWRSAGGRGRPWIAVESLYSMDGDRAPLQELMAVADAQDAMLVIDEAHATGVFGPDGRGLSSAFEGRDNVISVHTCGKALGVVGALLCAPSAMIDFLVNRSRPFIFATAPPPLMAAAVRESLRILKAEPQRRTTLMGRVALASRALETQCGVPPSGSQIIPVIVGDDRRAMKVAAAVQASGFDIRGIRPPTVPEGTSRLRIAITLRVSDATIDGMVAAVAEALNS